MTGAAATATGFNSFAAGARSVASGNSAVAIGADAQATGTNAIAIGIGAVATGSVAVGAASSAANGGAAYGDYAVATGTNATAVGYGSQAAFANAAAFGNGAAATRANQQVFGTASNTYTMSGIASAESRGAQSGPTQIVTSDVGGNLATASLADLGLASVGDIAAINSQLANVNERLNDLTRESRRGIAAAMAMTTAPMPSANGRTSWATNAATFRGEGAFGLSLAHRLDVPVPLALTGGNSYGGGNAHGGRIGLQGEF